MTDRIAPAVIAGDSRIEGRGAFAARNLPARRKIGELDGALVSVAEGRRRAALRERVHLVELDENLALDCSDGTSPLRFMNHSCAPNAFMRVAHRRVEIYALRAIASGEEITANYGETHHEGRLPCRCGATGCQGFI